MQLLTSPILCFAQLQGVAQGHLSLLHLSWLRVKLPTIQLCFSPPVHCFSVSFKVTSTLPSTACCAADPVSENVVAKCAASQDSNICVIFPLKYFFLMSSCMVPCSHLWYPGFKLCDSCSRLLQLSRFIRVRIWAQLLEPVPGQVLRSIRSGNIASLKEAAGTIRKSELTQETW